MGHLCCQSLCSCLLRKLKRALCVFVDPEDAEASGGPPVGLSAATRRHSTRCPSVAAKGGWVGQCGPAQLPAPLPKGHAWFSQTYLTASKHRLVWKAVEENLCSPFGAAETGGRETSHPSNSLLYGQLLNWKHTTEITQRGLRRC